MQLKRGLQDVLAAIAILSILSACELATENDLGSVPAVEVVVDEPAAPPPSNPPAANTKPTPEEASRFLIASTFGPNIEAIDDLVSMGYSDWYQYQLGLPMRSIVEASWANFENQNGNATEFKVSLSEFLENSVLGEDQLRMRAAYALSQLFVISVENEIIAYDGEGTARYMDILQEGAFGNFRDLLEEITYSPMMGEYLTYAGNRKADADMGSAPDENFAREVMQLFTIGLYELNQDGSVKLSGNNEPIETYSNEDITELAKVFTGLWWDGLQFGQGYRNRSQNAQISRMVMHDEMHSPGAKTFLGRTIPESADGDETIRDALDVLFEHPNVAPFVSRQLIQRFTTSNPTPAYIERVANTFDTGQFELPSGALVGTGVRGDMGAVWAAILFDSEHMDVGSAESDTSGKIREPFIRLTHWARMADIPRVDMVVNGELNDPLLFDMVFPERLGQRPFSAPSVFNFYDPDYSAPGSRIANAGMVSPEMQITTTSAVTAYADFMRDIIYRDPGDSWQRGEFGAIGAYSEEIKLADDTIALVDRLDLLMTAGRMSTETRYRLGSIIESVELSEADPAGSLRDRVQLAVLFAAVSPEYLVQR